eukprot:gb/GECH01012217.1/.p1 GENE.gb/GECH01012217.1/~~gb/GECH01012217.1/.p1  ORF type:complete len:239 (+),score=41.63 gb/GECH01012217.1/:1-717(+)
MLRISTTSRSSTYTNKIRNADNIKNPSFSAKTTTSLNFTNSQITQQRFHGIQSQYRVPALLKEAEFSKPIPSTKVISNSRWGKIAKEVQHLSAFQIRLKLLKTATPVIAQVTSKRGYVPADMLNFFLYDKELKANVVLKVMQHFGRAIPSYDILKIKSVKDLIAWYTERLQAERKPQYDVPPQLEKTIDKLVMEERQKIQAQKDQVREERRQMNRERRKRKKELWQKWKAENLTHLTQ